MDYCDVFISSSDSHSDGTHSLQTIHCLASDVMLNFSEEKTISNTPTTRCWKDNIQQGKPVCCLGALIWIHLEERAW